MHDTGRNNLVKVGDEVVVVENRAPCRLQRVTRVTHNGTRITLDDGSVWLEGGQRLRGRTDYMLKIRLATDRHDVIAAYKSMIGQAVRGIDTDGERAVERLKCAFVMLRGE